MKKLSFIFSISIVFVFQCNQLKAQDGTLDLTFDTDGIVTTIIGHNSGARSLAIQTDGKIVVAGYSSDTDSTDDDFAVARYNSSGSLDTGFDNDGKLTTEITSEDDMATAVAIQSDGKIVVAGHSYNGTNMDMVVVRYNTDGSLDNTFDSDGIVILDYTGANEKANGIVIQNDGKILLCGSAFNGSIGVFSVVRLNSDGSLDATFDNDGYTITPIGPYGSSASSIALQADGKIVAAGADYYSMGGQIALVRYNTDGSLDPSFDLDGLIVTSLPIDSDAKAIAIQDDGKIVVTGKNSVNGLDVDFAVLRYNSDGSLDLTFNNTGIVITDVGSADLSSAVAIQDDGRILAFGNDSTELATVRYTEQGSLDNTFGINGTVHTSLSDTNFGYSIGIQTDAKIVVAGITYMPTDSVFAFALVRYNATNNASIGVHTGLDIEFFPNPAEDFIFVNGMVDNVQIYDQTGRTVLELNNIKGEEKIDISNLSGCYFIRLSNQNKVLTKPLIIK